MANADLRLIPISQDSLEWQCSVLKIGGLTVLLNCGWTEALDPKLLNPLVPYLPELDLILLTHADLKHLGAIPYLLTKHPTLTCPVVCTEPICRLGELSCVATLEDREKYQAPSEHVSVDDVLRVFMSRVTPLSYREPYQVQVRGRTLTACPYPAGHHLGSAYWTLHCGGLSAVYLVDCDMRRSRFLDGLDQQRLLPASRGTAQPWDIVITSPVPEMGELLPQRGARQAPVEMSAPTKALSVARSVREQLLLEGSIATLRRGGSVIIPADVAGSIPEVLLMLDAAWEQDRQLSSNYPLVWLSSMGDIVLDQIKTRLEWMSKEVLGNFEKRLGTHPFVLKNVRIFQSLEELCSVHPLSRPKVILTTSPHLEGGDSRELFMRLSHDPRTLIWLLGLPANGGLARQLLDDFVLKHANRKEYHLPQYLKQPLPDEQLRAYYEAKILELAESGAKLPRELELFKAEVEDLARVKMEEAGPPEASPSPPPEESLEAPMAAPVGSAEAGVAAAGGAAPAAPPRRVAAVSAKGSTAALWTPLGWAASRTLAHSETRNEGDEYGHLLSSAEMKLWKAQDQGSEKYGTAAEGAEAGDALQVKEETAKQEDDELPPSIDAFGDWRDICRIHFPEPMHSEVRERTVRVSCRIRYLPDTMTEPSDLYMLLRTVGPRHVVLLPSADDFATGRVLQKQFSNSRLDLSSAPAVHVLKPEAPALQLSLRAPKRRLQFNQELWPKLSFLRARDGIRVARVRAALPAQPPDAAARGVVELRPCRAEAPGGDSGGAEGADGGGSRLPRTGALFLSLGEEALSLSSLKEQLAKAEWTQPDVNVDFQALKTQRGAPWSARVLAAGNNAVLGWTEPQQAPAPPAATKQAPVLRLEGVPGEEFFASRRALYKRCAVI